MTHRRKQNRQVISIRDFFDPLGYVSAPVKEGCCLGCGRPANQCRLSPRERLAFHKMTGLTWPAPTLLVGYPIRRDVKQLGLDATKIPKDRTELCPACAVVYMTEFNEFLAAMEGRD